MKYIVILLIANFFCYLYMSDNMEISRFLPFKEKIAVKLVKESFKDNKINNYILESSVSAMYCMNTKTHSIKYYPKNSFSTYIYDTRNLNCIFDSTMKEAFEYAYYKDKSKLEIFMDKCIKGFTD